MNDILSLEIGLLHGLVNLTLSNLDVVGPLPLELASLPSFRFLNFSGEFPDVDPDGFLALEFIDAYNNNLTGPLPLGLAAAPRLWYLNLYNNFFYGEIPESYSEIKNLEYLGLNSNSLTGRVPASLSHLSKIKEMYIGYFNTFFGGVPPEFVRLPSLV
ncbi:hypothetical protein ZIOFF_053557 [Zingiber officinale]|uniref:Uncharacterized protein n=1 Tax=Zingiber officinale TaxID=94328 RepID=A0A8J5KNM0_ZINOF|nr:hypothetical protein ZIOFF_053557 [Zingiber officinale]